MTSSRARFVTPRSPLAALCSGLAGAVLVLASGCNFIFNPENSDDVIRCKNTTECEQQATFRDSINTGRLDASCGAPGSGGGDFTSSKTNQVCSVTDKASVSCIAENLPAGPYLDAVNAAEASGIYTACPGDKRGTLGCPARDDGSCDSGLTSNPFKTCDDNKGAHPLYSVTTELALQDVRDQHCRSYFCDDSFVCNNRTSKCQRCDDDLGADGIGRGACGELAFSGMHSSVYQSQEQLESACPDASTFEKTQFGPPVEVAP